MTLTFVEKGMGWARMLAYITGTVDQELLLRNEYLAAENCLQGSRNWTTFDGRPAAGASINSRPRREYQFATHRW